MLKRLAVYSISLALLWASLLAQAAADLPVALGSSNLMWRTSTSTPWYAESDFAHDGIAAGAATARPTTESILEAAVRGPGTLTFYWAATRNVSIAYFVDGHQTTLWPSSSPSDAPQWKLQTVYVGPGLHFLTWMAHSSSSIGTAYLDDVTFTLGATAPTITYQPRGGTYVCCRHQRDP